jgi:hypothetical protein
LYFLGIFDNSVWLHLTPVVCLRLASVLPWQHWEAFSLSDLPGHKYGQIEQHKKTSNKNLQNIIPKFHQIQPE